MKSASVPLNLILLQPHVPQFTKSCMQVVSHAHMVIVIYSYIMSCQLYENIIPTSYVTDEVSHAYRYRLHHLVMGKHVINNK